MGRKVPRRDVWSGRGPTGRGLRRRWLLENSLIRQQLEDVVRSARPRLIALLAAADGDIAAAEDAFSDAVEQALLRWPVDGVPDRPEPWLFTVARNRRRDRWRTARRDVPLRADLPVDDAHSVDAMTIDIPDRRLALLAAAAHPGIEPAARTPLMLNTVLGLTAEQIGSVLLVPTATMAARLTRAKKRIRDGAVSFEVPEVNELPARLDAIRAAIHGAYAVEWMFSPAETRPGLIAEALFLAELLTELVPGDPESHGLAALLCLSEARSAARHDENGDVVPLDKQDVSHWDQTLLNRGEEHLRFAGTSTTPGPFRIQAAIQAVHCARRRTGTTDWSSLRRLHAGLQRLAPSIGGAVAAAVVTARCEGPLAGLRALDAIGPRAHRFQPALSVRARLLADADRLTEAIDTYDLALGLTTDAAERRFLERARDGLTTA